MAYDQNNVFAKILRGDLPCDKIYEDDFALAFRDINPQAPVHVLVIPKGPYVSIDEFSNDATADEQAGLMRAIGATARELGLIDGGYRVLANKGRDAHQEVMHLHFHIFAGRPLGPMLEDGALPPGSNYRRP
ncbi:MAG: histidine triad nucleotide-binding protein [Rhodospirillales bacterium]|nr:histidine triad nucleotide-binding protein [Rhodospirillales bacterium]